MSEPQQLQSCVYKYSFEIPINCEVSQVWSTLFERIDGWWMNDFRALGEGSVVSLDARAGRRLLERGKNGEELEWYTVQMIVPGESVYLVG